MGTVFNALLWESAFDVEHMCARAAAVFHAHTEKQIQKAAGTAGPERPSDSPPSGTDLTSGTVAARAMVWPSHRWTQVGHSTAMSPSGTAGPPEVPVWSGATEHAEHPMHHGLSLKQATQHLSSIGCKGRRQTSNAPAIKNTTPSCCPFWMRVCEHFTNLNLLSKLHNSSLRY